MMESPRSGIADQVVHTPTSKLAGQYRRATFRPVIKDLQQAERAPYRDKGGQPPVHQWPNTSMAYQFFFESKLIEASIGIGNAQLPEELPRPGVQAEKPSRKPLSSKALQMWFFPDRRLR